MLLCCQAWRPSGFWDPKNRRSLVWSGWWTWVLPLVLFAVWLVIGCLTKPEFYNDVVIKEFMSRFDQSLKAYEKQQPIWFYFPHLLHKFAPWSLLALALPIASENVRSKNQDRPRHTLACLLGAWRIALHDLDSLKAGGSDLSR